MTHHRGRPPSPEGGPDHPFFFGGRFFRGGFPPVPPGPPPPPGAPPPPGVPPFPPFPFGHGPNPWLALFRRRGRARRGDVRAAILALLAEQPRNGYQIMQALEQRSHGMWRPSPGSVYPALQLLEDEGLVRVDTTADGKTFHLTDRGREAVDEADAAPWESVTPGADGRAELMEAIRHLMAAAAQVAQTGTAAQITAAQQVIREARRALYRILADDPDPGAVGDEAAADAAAEDDE